MQATKQIKTTELEVGMIVRFHGARFEIIDAKMVDHNTAGPITEKTAERDRVMVAHGKWLSGSTVTAYFGPEKDWTFQGNSLSYECIEI